MAITFQKKAKGGVFRQLQRLGPSMMPVIAMMPVAGILYGLGAIMTDATIVGYLTFLSKPFFVTLSNILFGVGNFITSNLHIFFAIAIAAGYTNHDGIAALSGGLSFFVMNKTIEIIGGITGEMVATDWQLYASVLGINTLSMGVFGGILCGCLTAWLFNKFKDIKLPSAISFFQGKRFVPIVTIAASILVALPVYWIWPLIQSGITAFGEFIVGYDSAWWTPIVLVLAMRLLLVFGLHTLIYVPLAFQFGTWINSAGEVFHGAYPIFFAQMADGAELTTYQFVTGNYIMIFCYLALGTAFILTSRKERRKQTKSQIIPTMITVGVTGISEPLEYSYVFNSFPAYILHSVVMACLVPLVQLFHVTVATGSWGGAVDFLIYGILSNNATWPRIIPAGLLAFAIEFAIMFFAIRRFKLRTPGNELEEADEIVEAVSVSDDSLPFEVLKALGGKENVRDVDACATRLRVSSVDGGKVDQKALKALGAAGIVKVGDSLQVIFGAKAILLKEQINAILAGKAVETKVLAQHIASDVEEDIVSPANGRLIPLAEVKDKVFSEAMLGPGFGVIPTDGSIVSPMNGRIIDVFEAKHAITILSDGGREVLVHMGLNTVEMNGEPFQILVQKEQLVSTGTPLAKMNLKKIKDSGRDTTVVVAFTNEDAKTAELLHTGTVKAGDGNVARLTDKE